MAAGFPSAILVEIEFTAGVWTDVSSSVVGDSIEIHVGRDSASSGIQPGTLDLDLDNLNGTFTPDNPTSTYYPNFVEGKRIRVRVTKSATTYVRFVGRIVSLEPDFPSEPSQSRTHVSAVDLLGDLERIKLKSLPESLARLATSGNTRFYPLNDANEHVGMSDVLGLSRKLTVWDKTPGTGRIDARSDDTLGDGESYVKLFNGKGLIATRALSMTTPCAQLLVRVSSSSYGEVFAFSIGRREDAGEFVRVRWTSTGFIADTYSGGVLVDSSSTFPAEDGWHLILLSGSGSIEVDGTPAVTSGFIGTQGDSFSIGGAIDMSAAHLYLVDLGSGGYTYGPQSALPGWETTLAEALTTLGIGIGATGLSAAFAWTSTPTPTAEPPVMFNQSAGDVVAAIADSQSGMFYAVPSTSATQTVQLVASAEYRPSTVALTVDAEGDLSGGPTLTRTLGELVANATASSTYNTITATDNSITEVGSAAAEVRTLLLRDSDLYGVASDRIARGRDQRTRITQLTVDLATASNDLYASFYGVTPGERLRLSVLSTTYFGVSYIDGYVEGYTERPGINGYEVTFDLSPADAPPEAKADDTTYARVPFGDGVCTVTGGTAVGTTATGTMTLTFTGSDLLSTAAGDYPMDFDWNGERVTVTSAPAGGSSPRTLTITARGVAPTVARSHSAGERIDLWLGASVAL